MTPIDMFGIFLLWFSGFLSGTVAIGCFLLDGEMTESLFLNAVKLIVGAVAFFAVGILILVN